MMMVRRAWAVFLMVLGVFFLWVVLRVPLGLFSTTDSAGVVETVSCESRGRVSVLDIGVRSEGRVQMYGSASRSCSAYGDLDKWVGKSVVVTTEEGGDNDILGLRIGRTTIIETDSTLISVSIVGGLIGAMALLGGFVLGKKSGLFARTAPRG